MLWRLRGRWWRMFETICAFYELEMLVTDFVKLSLSATLPISTLVSRHVGHQYPKDFTKILSLSLRCWICLQLYLVNITIRDLRRHQHSSLHYLRFGLAEGATYGLPVGRHVNVKARISIAFVRFNSIKTQFIFGAGISSSNALVCVDTISCLITIISSITDITNTCRVITEMSFSDRVLFAGPST